MPDSWAGLTSKPEVLWVAIGALGILAVAVVYAVRNRFVRRLAPEELERRRRATVHREGKMGDGEIIDVETASASIVYSYSVAGVIYTASQDVGALRSLLPLDAM